MANEETGKKYPFYAMLSRMKHINRWGLMRNTRGDNIAEHSLQVAMIAHSLALLRNGSFGGAVDAERTAVLAMFHDCDEILTGDLPTPVKYFNESILIAYREVEDAAKNRLLSLLPDAMRPEYSSIFHHLSERDSELWDLVKAADTISAYVKCLEEIAGGNTEFATAAKSIRRKLESIDLPEVRLFISDFVDAFSLSLDDYGI